MSHIFVKDNLRIFPFNVLSLPKQYPNTSFPQNFIQQDLSEYGVFSVVQKPTPMYDPLVEEVSLKEPEFVDNQWIQNWEIVQKRQDLAERNIRNRRNDLLTESDWTQVLDSPVDRSAWAQYRQQLRDITAQPGFPYSVNWPMKPE